MRRRGPKPISGETWARAKMAAQKRRAEEILHPAKSPVLSEAEIDAAKELLPVAQDMQAPRAVVEWIEQIARATPTRTVPKDGGE